MATVASSAATFAASNEESVASWGLMAARAALEATHAASFTSTADFAASQMVRVPAVATFRASSLAFSAYQPEFKLVWAAS